MQKFKQTLAVTGKTKRKGGKHTPSIAFRHLPRNSARIAYATLKGHTKLQALVYDILPSTTAVFSYAIGSRKLSANEQFFCWFSNSSKFVTNNSYYIRRSFYVAMLLTPAQIKPKSFETRRGLVFFLPGVDASHVYVRALALGCFYSHIIPKPFGGR